MDELKVSEVIADYKSKFTAEYLKPYAESFGESFNLIKKLIEDDKWTLEECENVYTLMNNKCSMATKAVCNKVRISSRDIAEVSKGEEPCDACFVNCFCCYAKNKQDSSWHMNMINISDKLMDIYRFNKEVTQKDKDFIIGCYKKMLVAPEYELLLKICREWDI